jgi:beta-galactosidase
VTNGGVAIVTYMSGIVDENLHVHLGGYPGAFRDWLGVSVEEFYPLRKGEQVVLDDDSIADTWTELVHLDGAMAVTTYKDGPLPGLPAVTRHEHGAGTAWYIGTKVDQDALNRLVKDALRAAKVKPPVPTVTLPAGVEVMRRSGDSGSFLFVINHGNETAHVLAKGHDLVANRPAAGTLSLRPGAVAVVREEAV